MDTSRYYVAFALGNLCGPLVLGPLFDIAGRRFMISVSYLTAGVLLTGSAVAFQQGLLTATTQTQCWTVGYLVGAGVMAAGGLVELIFGVAAERKSLEEVARPLSMIRQAAESLAGTLASGGAVGSPVG